MGPNPYGSSKRGWNPPDRRSIFTHRETPPRFQKKRPPPPAVSKEQDSGLNLLLQPQNRSLPSTSRSATKARSSDAPLVVPDYAVELVRFCREAMAHLGRTKTLWNAAVPTLTLTSVVAAVLYGHVYGNMPSFGDGIDYSQWVLYVATIALPCLTAAAVASRQAIVRKGNPFPVALAKIESQIFSFRARVPPYKKKASARDALRKKLAEIYDCHVVAKDHTLNLEDDFWKNDGDDEEDIAKTNESITSVIVESTSNAIAFDHTFAQLPAMNFVDVESPPPAPDESTPLLTVDDADDEKEDSKPKAAVDDGRSPVTPQEYQMFRLDELSREQSQAVTSLSQKQSRLESMAKVLTLSTAAMAVVSLQWAVPMVLAIAAGASQGLEFGGYRGRCEQAAMARDQLAKIQEWWKGVPQTDQDWQLSRLVQETEAAASVEG